MVGAGIAGASVAALLGRAGDEVTLVEKAKGQRTSGSPVDVRGGALPVVGELEVSSRLRQCDTGVHRVEFVNERGQVRARAAMRRDTDADIEISRSVLNKVLLDVAGEVAGIAFGESPVALVQDPGGVEATFSKGGSARFDLVIGADGQHSTVRRLAFGPELDYSRPFGLCIATVPVDAALITAPDVVQICNVPRACMSVHPAGGKPIAAFIFRVDAADQPLDIQDQRRILTQHFRHRGWRSLELLRALDDPDDVYFDAVTRVAVPRWSQGRVVLLGDAASSITILGEGCSMAIEGAGALAAALDEILDVPAALDAYEGVFRPRVTRQQRGAGYAASVLVPKTTAGIALRNAFVRLAGRV